jgi:hypothetical protein
MLAGMMARPRAIFLAHELGRHEVGDGGAEVLAVADARAVLLAAQVLADGDIFHLGGDDPGAGVFVLGDQLAGLGRDRPCCSRRRTRGQVLALGEAVVLGLHLAGLGTGSTSPRATTMARDLCAAGPSRCR